VILEVRDRGWATDGLEKYLRPAKKAAEPTTTRVVLPANQPLMPAAKSAISQAVADNPRATVVVETIHRSPDSAAVRHCASRRAARHVRRRVGRGRAERGRGGSPCVGAGVVRSERRALADADHGLARERHGRIAGRLYVHEL
jgi:hypothetical protein